MRSAILIAGFALWGCGDNIAAIPFDAFDAARQDARCSYLVRCGQFVDQPTCLAYFRPRANDAMAAAIGGGLVVYDPVQAVRCVEEQAATSCDLTSRQARVATECSKVFTGMVADGGSCAFDAECGSEDCVAPLCPRDMCCAGSCNPTHATSEIDGPCEIDAHCVEDLYCGGDQLCHALVSIGQPCDSDSACDYGLACIGATAQQSGACRAMPLIGAACPYQRCAQLGARCDATSTCVAVGLAGAGCPTSSECSPYAHCDPSQLCADAPTLGSSCTTACGGEAWCKFDGQAVGTCVVPTNNGEPCGADNECASLFCQQGPAFDACAKPAVCI